MGSGAEAAKSSALITGVLQRMIASDMEIVAAVKTVNRLIHSDVYATLDVICVNAHTQKAYLVKSAACPTLLIRQGAPAAAGWTLAAGRHAGGDRAGLHGAAAADGR